MIRFFKSLDKEGWCKLLQGILLIVATIYVMYFVSVYVHLLIAAVICLVGFDFAFRMFDEAMLGSIYRNREGKNRDLYLPNKAKLDKRFEEVLKIKERTKKHRQADITGVGDKYNFDVGEKHEIANVDNEDETIL